MTAVSTAAARITVHGVKGVPVPKVMPSDRQWYAVAVLGESSSRSAEAFSTKAKPRVITRKGKQTIEVTWPVDGRQMDVIIPPQHDKKAKLLISLFVESVMPADADVCVGQARVPVKRRRKKSIKLRGFNTGWVPAQKVAGSIEIEVEMTTLETPRLSLDDTAGEMSATWNNAPAIGGNRTVWDAFSESGSSDDEKNGYRARARRGRSGGLRVGSQIHGRYLGGDVWVPGVVTAVRPNQTYDVKYTDGSVEMGLGQRKLRIPMQTGTQLLQDMWKSGGEERDYASSDGSSDFDDSQHDASDALNIIEDCFQSRTAGKPSKILAHFQKYADAPGRDTKMTPQALQQALADLGISDLTKQQSSSLRRLLDPHMTGLMDFGILVKAHKGGGSSASRKRAHVESIDVNMVIGRLRKAIRSAQRKGSAPSPWNTFELYDQGGRGHVAHRDAKRAMALLGCHIDGGEMRLLDDRLRLINANVPIGRVDYTELLHMAVPELSRNSSLLPGAGRSALSAFQVNKTLGEIRAIVQEASRVRGEKIDVKRAFAELDMRAAGTLPVRLLKRGLARCGIVVLPEHIRAIVQRFGVHSIRADGGSGRETYSRATRVDYAKLSDFISDLEALYASLRPQLRQAQSRGINAWNAFRAIDIDDTGLVSKVDFRRILLAVLGLRMREGEMRDLMVAFAAPGPARRVDYVRFLHAASPRGSAGIIAGDLSGLEVKLRTMVRNAALSVHMTDTGTPYAGDYDLRSAFSRFDYGSTGRVCNRDFFAGLESMGLKLNAHEKRHLSALFDPKGNGSFDYNSFLKFAGFDDLELDEIAGRIAKRLSTVTSLGIDYVQCFKLFDANEGQFISRREFREACRTIAIPVTEAELHALMERFASVADRELVGYADFLRFVSSRGTRAKRRYRAEETERRIRRMQDKEGIDARTAVDGSGHDGLGRKDPAHSNMLRSAIASAKNSQRDDSGQRRGIMHAPWKVNRWLEGGATSDERARFLNLRRSFEDFDRRRRKSAEDTEERIAALEHSQEKSSVYNHSLGTVGRIVDHASGRHGYYEDGGYNVVPDPARSRRQYNSDSSYDSNDGGRKWRTIDDADSYRGARRGKSGRERSRSRGRNRNRNKNRARSDSESDSSYGSGDRRERRSWSKQGRRARSRGREGKQDDDERHRRSASRSRKSSSRRSESRSPRGSEARKRRERRRRSRSASRSPRGSVSPARSDSSFDPISNSIGGRRSRGKSSKWVRPRNFGRAGSDTSDF